MVKRLGPAFPVEIPHIVSSIEIVTETLRSACTLLQVHGPAHAIDRIHTALHGYLKDKCREQEIIFASDDQITRLYRLLRDKHPALALPVDWKEEVDLVMKVQSTVLDKLNRVRNDDSFAHPNSPLPEEEAYLFIDAAATLFRYLEAKFRTR